MELYQKFFKKKSCKIEFKKVNSSENNKTDNCFVMLLYKRPETLKQILNKLEEQTEKVDVYLWNNNYEEKFEFENILNKYFTLSNININLYNSKENIKKIGRIITSHMLRKLYKNIIFFSDDQIMTDNHVIETFIYEVNKYPNTILSTWALDLNNEHTFWDRTRKFNNRLVDYTGGDGAIYPSNLFTDEFIEWMPYMFLSNEDFLCSMYIAIFMKGENRASNAKIEFISDQVNSRKSLSWNVKYCNYTGNEIHRLKTNMLKWSIEEYNYPNFKNKQLNLIETPYYLTNNSTFKSFFNFNHLFIILNKDSDWYNTSNFCRSIPKNANILYVRDSKNKWYFNGIEGLSTDLETNILYLEKKIKESKSKKVTVIGECSGGFASILYGIKLNIDHIIAFNPQTYLDKETILYYNDERWNLDKLEELEKNNSSYLNLKYLEKSNTKIDIIYSNNFIQKSHFENIMQNKNLNITGHMIESNDNELVKYLHYIGALSMLLKI